MRSPLSHFHRFTPAFLLSLALVPIVSAASWGYETRGQMQWRSHSSPLQEHSADIRLQKGSRGDLAQANPDILFSTDGMLADGDPVLDDGSVYDSYRFNGQAGQVLTIHLNSTEFDAYLLVIDPTGKIIAENDNASPNNGNARLTVTLPENSGYAIIANSRTAGERGRYTLVVTAGEGELSPTATRQAEGDRLLVQGQDHYRNGRLREALPPLQQALTIFQELGDRPSEGTTINTIGLVYRGLGQPIQSVEAYQQGLTIFQTLRQAADSQRLREGEGAALIGLGAGNRVLGQYEEALDYYQQALLIYRLPANTPQEQRSQRYGEGVLLDNIGVVYISMGQFSRALEQHRQAREIFQEIGNRPAESIALNNIAAAYEWLGQYPQALEHYEQSLAIRQEANDPIGQGSTLDNIGLVYSRLGQYRESLNYRQQALELFRQAGDRTQEAIALNNIGVTYGDLGDDDRALEALQQALTLSVETGDRAGQSVTLSNLGLYYSGQGDYAKALETYQQSVAIAREVGNLANEGIALNNMGLAYTYLEQPTEALEYFQQALAIARETDDPRAEAQTLSNLGYLTRETQPELAIVFYKQSINITESIREQLRVLPQEQQASFTETVADTYRRLADLLLQQDRVLEAQQVLDLLKIQELEEYLNDIRGNEQGAIGLEYWQAEQTITDLHTQTLAPVQEYFRLQAILPTERTPEQQARLAELGERLEVQHSFSQFINTPTVTRQIQQLQRVAKGQNLNPDQLYRLQDDLRSLEQSTVLLYPLILDDRLELVLITPNAPPVRRSVTVSREQLNAVITDFRGDITNRTRSSTDAAQQLYQWLIQPIEADLQQAQAETILYAADGTLRYVPLAALYDGDEWLIQRFTINHITAASLTDFSSSRRLTSDSIRVLAAAFSDAERRYNFQVGTRDFSFNGLPYAGTEVENIAAAVPDTTELFNDSFSRRTVEPQLNNYTIVHLATHAEFVSGLPEESFILFGNGDRVTLRDVSNWTLENVDLVVLSACKTAVGGQLGNGEEILGFGYQMQRTGARAAIASLWSVDDGGTQILMNRFYAGLEQGLTKAEALRQAQIALITGDIPTSAPNQTRPPFHRPYYWAPFILIGNGL
ncbi:tetratricopeptide repeat protein [Oscillatoria sp. FACHB-1407]|uniref:tetratricopeptide repeat protein n=1 Tax=Oscillatoria sp. FACHB-1407 TaxID=2692847 RepID=UPI001686E777|nr:tetratricopeptide repeat protein [Oscillatoria sp. FACHB-1407]MBD2464929.1 tetratricopeptide repeat protein [Oscillatoria sp. FACHB-1407]